MPSVMTLRGPQFEGPMDLVSTAISNKLQTTQLPASGSLAPADADVLAARILTTVKGMVGYGTLIGLGFTIAFSSLAIGTYKSHRR